MENTLDIAGQISEIRSLLVTVTNKLLEVLQEIEKVN